MTPGQLALLVWAFLYLHGLTVVFTPSPVWCRDVLPSKPSHPLFTHLCFLFAKYHSHLDAFVNDFSANFVKNFCLFRHISQ